MKTTIKLFDINVSIDSKYYDQYIKEIEELNNKYFNNNYSKQEISSVKEKEIEVVSKSKFENTLIITDCYKPYKTIEDLYADFENVIIIDGSEKDVDRMTIDKKFSSLYFITSCNSKIEIFDIKRRDLLLSEFAETIEWLEKNNNWITLSSIRLFTMKPIVTLKTNKIRIEELNENFIVFEKVYKKLASFKKIKDLQSCKKVGIENLFEILRNIFVLLRDIEDPDITEDMCYKLRQLLSKTEINVSKTRFLDSVNFNKALYYNKYSCPSIITEGEPRYARIKLSSDTYSVKRDIILNVICSINGILDFLDSVEKNIIEEEMNDVEKYQYTCSLLQSPIEFLCHLIENYNISIYKQKEFIRLYFETVIMSFDIELERYTFDSKIVETKTIKEIDKSVWQYMSEQMMLYGCRYNPSFHNSISFKLGVNITKRFTFLEDYGSKIFHEEISDVLDRLKGNKLIEKVNKKYMNNLI